MSLYKGKRLSLNEHVVCDHNDQEIARYSLPTVVWGAEGAPLTPKIKGGIFSNPKVTIGQQEYALRRIFVKGGFFLSDYKILLVDKDNNIFIDANVPIKQPTTFDYQNNHYRIKAHAFFTFHFSLLKNDVELIRFRETTSFFNVSSRKDFSLQAQEKVDPMILIFSFFIVMGRFYHG